MKLKIKDQVKILSGKDRGRSGTILAIFPKESRVLVEGVNLYKKHMKPTRSGESGAIVTKPRPLPSSKLALLCPHCQKPTRIAYQLAGNGKKYRLCKHCQKIIDQSLPKKTKATSKTAKK